MKKLLLLAAAFIATSTAFAQENLAIKPIGEGVTVTATDSYHEGGYIAANAIDGDVGTRWGSNGGGDEAWFQLEWSEPQTFNTIKMLCEGAMNMGAHSYNIEVSSDGTEWETVASVVDKLTPGGEYETVVLDKDVTAKYVKLQGVKQGTFGYTFFEFEVYKLDRSVTELTTFTVSPLLVVAGLDTQMNFTVLDQNGLTMTDGVTFEVENGTLDENNVLHPTTSGIVTITAKNIQDDKTIEKTVLITALAADNTAPIPTVAESDVYAIYSDTYKTEPLVTIWPRNWEGGSYDNAYEIKLGEDNVYFTENVKAFGLCTNNNENERKSIADYKRLCFDVYVLTEGSVEATVDVRFADNNNILPETAFKVEGGKWHHVEIPLTGMIAENKDKTVTYVVWKFKNHKYDAILFDNVYFSKEVVEDTEKPEFIKAEATVVNAKSAVLTVAASDNNPKGFLKYTVKNGEETITVKENVTVNAEAEIELSNLTPETSYKLTVIVADESDNTAETTVEFTTPVNITVTENERGVWVIEGETTVENIEKELADNTKTAFDLTGLSLPADVTSLNVGNPNALIVVTETQFTQLKDMKNLFGFQGNLYYVLKTDCYEITDGYPVYTNYFISTGANGYKYTRNIVAGKYVTTTLPTNIELPEGISAYEFDAQNENVYTFKRIENKQLAAHTPYILYSAEGATLEVTGTIDLYMTEAKDIVCGDLTFHGNYETFAGDGTQYGLFNSTESIVLNKVDGGTIGAFRGYFTVNGDESAAKNIRFIFNNGGTDGISSVNGETTAKAGNVYTIDGRFVNSNGSVEGLAKGLYIVGGKKVVVK